MKHCPYCKSDYKNNETKCPTCSAVEYETKCDNCNTIHKEKFCPNCGHDSTADSESYNKTIGGVVGGIVSGVNCKISGHDWFGCKCRRCGETRDENHSFIPIPGTSQERCSFCGKTRDVVALEKEAAAKSRKTKMIWTIILLFIFPPAGILLTWLVMKDWDLKTKIIVSVASAILLIYAISSADAASSLQGDTQELLKSCVYSY